MGASAGSEIPELLQRLKHVYKTKGLLYRDISLAMGTHENTTKRYLSGRGLTLQIFEALCRVADISLTDLVRMSRIGQGDLGWLTLEHEEALVTDPVLAVLFYLLHMRYPPDVLQRELELNDADLKGYLRELHRLRLIQVSPGNKVKLEVARELMRRVGR